MLKAATTREGRKGFTLAELAVVIVTVGVLAAFGVPRVIKSVERSKAAEAFSYLAAVRAAQERYHARESSYADDLAKLEIKSPAPRFFTVGNLAAAGGGTPRASWELRLTRIGPPAGNGTYTVTFNQDGYDSANSTIDGYPDLKPTGTDPSPGSSGHSGGRVPGQD